MSGTAVSSVWPITNVPRDYDWGQPGGISRLLGWQGSEGRLEAELWLGAHPVSPSRVLDPAIPWGDLAQWSDSTGTDLPFLLKVLAAQRPLSVQAHPSEEQARAGFAREEAAGVPLRAAQRSYKDPYAKPELIVALEDGFEALCGLRPVADTLQMIGDLEDGPDGTDGAGALAAWRRRLDEGGLAACVSWLLAGGPEVESVITAVSQRAAADPDRFPLAARLVASYPGDPGIGVALMLNHLRLRAGEALFLPARNMHAYLSGVGMELMGPSDNVLRGGLTSKHIDRAELIAVVDFVPRGPALLAPVVLDEHARSYRPRSTPEGRGVGFELVRIAGPTGLVTGSPAVLIATDGAFSVAVGGEHMRLARGQAALVAEPGAVVIDGSGQLFLAATDVLAS